VIEQTDPTITEGQSQNFTYLGMANNQYNWSINCTDTSENNNIGSSSTLNLTINLDYVAPVINSVAATPDPVPIPGNVLNITADITDDRNISSAWITYNNTNYTMSNDGDTYYNSSFNTDLPAGIYNFTIYANDTSNNNATPVTSNFTVSIYISLSLTNGVINFTDVYPNEIANATAGYGWPVVITNNGNVNENITIKGTNLVGLTNPSYQINVNRVQWNYNTDFGAYYLLNSTEQTFYNDLARYTNQTVYFRLFAPKNIISQGYRGNVSFYAYQS